MKILITNDDGIDADGIKRLARIAKKFGEVYVMAPSMQCSAMSHRITLGKKLLVKKFNFEIDGVKAYSLSGSPADCVKVGISDFFCGKPDLVLSGINYGYNIGHDIQYSGTVGAAMDAASIGIAAIAFSEEAIDEHNITEYYLEKILAMLIEKIQNNPLEVGTILNVNFPGGSITKCKGIKENVDVSRRSFYKDVIECEKISENDMEVKIVGVYSEDGEVGSDFEAVCDGYITIGKIKNIGM